MLGVGDDFAVEYVIGSGCGLHGVGALDGSANCHADES